MLDLGARAGLGSLLLRQRLRQAFWQPGDVAGAGSDAPLQVVTAYALVRTLVARVGPDVLLLAVQQVGNLLDVGFFP